MARGLFPMRLAESGLESALEELAGNINDLFKTQCQFHCDKPFAELDSTMSLHLYYIAQEAALNAARHGKATRVNITITGGEDRFTLEIQDDGTGFQLPLPDSAGMGIRIMRYRARMIGATLNLKSRPNQGTQIIVQFNRKPDDQLNHVK
jgi:signal transduction histidine kinase